MKKSIVPKKHDVVIFDDGGSAAVAPGQLLVREKDMITFRNLTETPVKLVFPDNDLFKGKDVVLLDPGKKTTPPLEVDEVKHGAYPYTVYRGEHKQFAHASIPIIIIYDRD